jgi:hypothetical protein
MLPLVCSRVCLDEGGGTVSSRSRVNDDEYESYESYESHLELMVLCSHSPLLSTSLASLISHHISQQCTPWTPKDCKHLPETAVVRQSQSSRLDSISAFVKVDISSTSPFSCAQLPISCNITISHHTIPHPLSHTPHRHHARLSESIRPDLSSFLTLAPARESAYGLPTPFAPLRTAATQYRTAVNPL